MKTHTRGSVLIGAFAVLLLATLCADGAPHVPINDAVVLERVPAALAARKLAPLRRKLSARPDDLQSALELAHGYLDIGRETSDPRFVSYAHATLTPWLQHDPPPAPVLVLAATALQSSHRFDPALAMLDRALAIEPGNGQAWLTKATILQVQGKFPAARTACKHLVKTAGEMIALGCITSVDSLSGRLAPSYSVLQRFFATHSGAEDGIRSWVLGQLGEMAMRLGDFAAAEAHFKAALRATPADIYLKGAYADLLLAQNREQAVVRFLSGSESHDALLLRLAIAAQRLGGVDAKRWEQLYDARRRAARADDNPHLREHARFLLEVRDEPAAALRLAQMNWQVQREPADVRVYLQAAQRAQKPDAVALLHQWIRETGFEDCALKTTSCAAAHPSL